MIDLQDMNEDIDFNYTATEILQHYAPHLLNKVQNEFLELHLAQGNIVQTEFDGGYVWKED
jgi:hypothetical protein